MSFHKLLILNVHSAKNAGDLAILEETLTCLQHAFPDAAVTVAINDTDIDGLPENALYLPSLTRWLVDLDSMGAWSWHKTRAIPHGVWLMLAALLYRIAGVRLTSRVHARRQLMVAYYEADVVVVLGGGHLYARHAFNIAFLWLWVGIAFAVLLGKPVVLLPQSFGPLPGIFQRRLLGWLLRQCHFVAAREYRSLQLLASIGLRQHVLVLPDLAFTTAEAPAEQVDEILCRFQVSRASQQLKVGLTVMDWGGQNPNFPHQQDYEAAVTSLIRHLRQNYDAEVVLFAQCVGPTEAQDDRRMARRIVSMLDDTRHVRLIDIALPPNVLKAAYRRMDLFVATRMHSAIFALETYVPTLVIGYLHKSIGIMEMFGLEQHVVEIDQIAPRQLCEAFDVLWQERSTIRRRLKKLMPAARVTLERLPMLIRSSVEQR